MTDRTRMVLAVAIALVAAQAGAPQLRGQPGGATPSFQHSSIAASQPDLQRLPPAGVVQRAPAGPHVAGLDRPQHSSRRDRRQQIPAAVAGQFAQPASVAAAAGAAPVFADAASSLPARSAPWWQPAATRPLRPGAQAYPVHLENLVVDALRHSPQVRAIGDTALIRQTAIVEADAEFDVHAFAESKLVRTSDPTGSTLDAGVDVPRLREADWFYSAGLRRKNQLGGTLELSQRFGLRDSNSVFFVPDDQGNARLTLNYTQPLLNGFGQAYNRSLIVLAQIDTQAAWDQTSKELQDHLLAVTEAHWQLYLERAILLQKQRHLERAEAILRELEGRRSVDSLPSQIARARAAVTTRRTDLIKAAAAIRNAEARLRALVNAPPLMAGGDVEIVPLDPPLDQPLQIDLRQALITALENRPEVDQAMQEIRAASVRLDMATNELLPALDVVLETYVTGLEGDFEVGQAWVHQFSVGEPGYSAGMTFEVPLHNRAARARCARRRLELRQLTSQFQSTVETLKAEVEVAVRDVDTYYRQVQSKYRAMQAAEAYVNYLQHRWELLPGEDRAASFLLEDLLDAQDRLAAEEEDLARAQSDYAVSLARLQRAMGTLLQEERINWQQACADGLPQLIFEKQPSDQTP